MTEPQSAGATPVATGATPAQTPAQPAAAAQTPASDPATGYPDGLGDAGKRALDDMKAAKKAAEAEAKTAREELDKLRAATATDAEKALAQAKKDGAAEVLTKAQVMVRRSEVRAALASAGLAGNLLDLAARADEFAKLNVTDDGDVEGLAAAVEAFKKATPDLFKPATPNGGRPVDFGGGPRGTPPAAGRDMNTLIRTAAGRG
jgi:hypothetical protein